jgi:hypothetical protein
MTAGVYLIRNTVNGKRYVGSSKNVEQRWRQHRHCLNAGTSTCSRLQAAWRKYGPDAFAFEMVEVVLDDERRGEREQHWLDAFGSFRSGYNASPTVQVADYMPRAAGMGPQDQRSQDRQEDHDPEQGTSHRPHCRRRFWRCASGQPDRDLAGRPRGDAGELNASMKGLTAQMSQGFVTAAGDAKKMAAGIEEAKVAAGGARAASAR